jgi:hypothetical protein
VIWSFCRALGSFLDRAKREGAVRIRKRDGQIFVLKPEKNQKSPLDVPGMGLDLGRDEIVELIREGRRRVE